MTMNFTARQYHLRIETLRLENERLKDKIDDLEERIAIATEQDGDDFENDMLAVNRTLNAQKLEWMNKCVKAQKHNKILLKDNENMRKLLHARDD